MNRRNFIRTGSMVVGGSALIYPMTSWGMKQTPSVMTVNGPISPESMGNTLAHEHILVDFIGAASYDPSAWKVDDVVRKVYPFLSEAKKAGCSTFIDCTPNYLGRDVTLLQKISDLSGLHILTNTGYYGGQDERYLPAHFHHESVEQVAARWISEWKDGINGTPIRPGFIKTSVNPGELSAASKKLIDTACVTHLATGLTIVSHTGPAVAAFAELELLKNHGVSTEAFVWTHAQNETNKSTYERVAKLGAWVSLDGLADDNVLDYVAMLKRLKDASCLHRVLVSHDAGWYEPRKPMGGNIRGYTVLFQKLIPALDVNGFTEEDIQLLIVKNPRDAFAMKVRKS